MGEQTFRVQMQSSASPDVLFAILEDVPGWTGWAPMVTSATYTTQGSTRPGDAGTVRRITGAGILKIDEKILEVRPPHYQRYSLTRGLPVSDYVGEVHLTPLGAGTALLWTGRFTASTPGLGPLLRIGLHRAIVGMAASLVEKAERAARIEATPGDSSPR
ncbi:SRPBCC family protein [Mycobacterium sp. Marseille-P9652]|uniref:SRPBCC family protein n=1 Tax=Mycobacterium sp. Marseille-P9652 TaxID=2654950 RepID=UPI0012E82892|nr:SRPBCC family protein [Mycobacterium sp. Marseille-P9652]